MAAIWKTLLIEGVCLISFTYFLIRRHHESYHIVKVL